MGEILLNQVVGDLDRSLFICTDPCERVLTQPTVLCDDGEVVFTYAKHTMLLIFSASVVLNNRVAPDAFFCNRLYATLVVVVTVIHYDISSVRCAEDTDDAVADIVALNF